MCFSFFRIINVVHLLLQPVAMPDSRENTLLLKWRQLSEVNENIWKATRASLLFERHFSLGTLCNIKERNCTASLHMSPPSLVLLEKNTCFDIWVFQLALPSTSCACSFGEERSSVCWHSSLLCFWPRRGGWARIKWVNPELGGLHWKGTTGKKFHLSFTTVCLKHMGRIRSYILISMSWGLGACLEIYARAWIWFETILCCAYTSSIFLWFSPLWSTGDGCRQDSERVVDSVDLIVSRELGWRKSKTQISFLQEDCSV